MKVIEPPLQIKRYNNRKLYAAEQKRYVNLNVLYQTLLSGRDIEVLDAKRNVDITPTMLGLIYQTMCIGQGYVPKDALLACIRLAGPPYDPSVA